MNIYNPARGSRLTVALGIFLTGAIIISAFAIASVLRNQEIEMWRKQLSNHSLTLTEYTYQLMAASYNALDSIEERVLAEGADTQDEFRRKLGTPAIHKMLKDKVELLPQVDVATVVAGNGDVINFTRSYPAPPINLSDRDYFKEHARGAAGADNFVSISVRNKGNGKWVFYISHRINDSHGQMLGLVLVGISVDSFIRFFEQLGTNFGSGASVTLYRLDFSVLTRWPLKEDLIGKINAAGSTYTVIENMKKDNDVIYTDSPRLSEDSQKVARLGAVRLVKKFPLILNVTVTENFFLTNWHYYMKWIVVISVGSIIILLTSIGVISSILRRRDLERKEEEAALRESEEKHRLLFNNAGDAIVINDFSGNILAANLRTCEVLGYTQAELLNMTVQSLDTPENNNLGTERMAQLKELGYITFKTEQLCKDGTIIPAEVSARIVTWYGQPAVMGIARNITERKKAEEDRRVLDLEIQQAQKMESLGVLAGGIAHDFNNILMAIMGNAELALKMVNPESPVIDNLKRIGHSAARAADLSRQMLAYSGKGKYVVERIDISRLVQEMLHIIEVTVSKKTMLQLDLIKPIPSVGADATQLRQIIINLIVNASEAIGDGSGVITITTGCRECDRNYLKSIWLNENLHDGLYVFLEVSDTGCGMDQDTLDKLFDPFFSTKFLGRGLGMAAVLGIVRSHNGAVRVTSEPGKGSSFMILLPALPDSPVTSAALDLSDHWEGSGTVLLVDDEETIRLVGSQMLGDLGFKVVTAVDGGDALEVFKSRDDIVLVVLDISMPNMNGDQCLNELRKLKPELKVIMSSGYDELDVSRRFVLDGLAAFIHKPYALSELKEVIKAVLKDVG